DSFALPALPLDRPQPFYKRPGAALSTVFLAGDEIFQSGGIVEELERTVELDGGAPGGNQLSWTMYRLPLAGNAPGSLTIDANVLPDVIGSPRVFHVAISDYADNRWRWLAPLERNHSVI